MQVALILFAWIAAAVAAIAPNSSAIAPNSSAAVSKTKISRIYNGQIYDQKKYPWVMALEFKKGSKGSLCTGSLVSPLFVLTAAHCTIGKSEADAKVHPHSHAYAGRPVERIYQHESYTTGVNSADISFLKLKTPFEDITEYAIMYGPPADFDNGKKELQCNVIGFGRTPTEGYSKTGLIIDIVLRYGSEKCELTQGYGNPKKYWEEFVCAKPDTRTTCVGDSGGPVICDGLLYAITSHASNYKNPNGEIECGTADTLLIFQYLNYYEDWIFSTTNIPKHNSKPNNDSKSSILTPNRFYTILFVLVHQHLKH